MKIYTRGGDAGETGLLDGSRVRKDHARIAACGDVDELNALLGVILATTDSDDLKGLLLGIQRDLFAVGAHLADPRQRVGAEKAKAALGPDQVGALERRIDEMEKGLPPLKAFILPGGSETGALLHLARTVCRRAERSVVSIAGEEDKQTLAYLNRLSDALFVLARVENRRVGKPEATW